MTKELASLDMDVHYEDNISLAPKNFMDRNSTLVVYTPAVPKDHHEYGYFLSNLGTTSASKEPARKNVSTSIFNFSLIHDQAESSTFKFLIRTRS